MFAQNKWYTNYLQTDYLDRICFYISQLFGKWFDDGWQSPHCPSILQACTVCTQKSVYVCVWLCFVLFLFSPLSDDGSSRATSNSLWNKIVLVLRDYTFEYFVYIFHFLHLSVNQFGYTYHRLPINIRICFNIVTLAFPITKTRSIKEEEEEKNEANFQCKCMHQFTHIFYTCVLNGLIFQDQWFPIVRRFFSWIIQLECKVLFYDWTAYFYCSQIRFISLILFLCPLWKLRRTTHSNIIRLFLYQLFIFSYFVDLPMHFLLIFITFVKFVSQIELFLLFNSGILSSYIDILIDWLRLHVLT